MTTTGATPARRHVVGAAMLVLGIVMCLARPATADPVFTEIIFTPDSVATDHDRPLTLTGQTQLPAFDGTTTVTVTGVLADLHQAAYEFDVVDTDTMLLTLSERLPAGMYTVWAETGVELAMGTFEVAGAGLQLSPATVAAGQVAHVTALGYQTWWDHTTPVVVRDSSGSLVAGVVSALQFGWWDYAEFDLDGLPAGYYTVEVGAPPLIASLEVTGPSACDDPIAGSAPPGLTNMGFEEGGSSWTAGIQLAGAAITGADAFTAPYDGPSMAVLGNAAASALDTQPVGIDELCQEFVVDEATETFFYNVFSYDAVGFDAFTYEVTDALGGTVVHDTVGSAGVAGSPALLSTDWTGVTLDLSDHLGETVRLAFTSGGTRDEAYPFWTYLDGVVDGAGPVPPPGSGGGFGGGGGGFGGGDEGAGDGDDPAEDPEPEGPSIELPHQFVPGQTIVFNLEVATMDPANNSHLALYFSQLAHPAGISSYAQAGGAEVLLASEAVFADALASGALQGDRALLLTDPDNLEPAVLEEIHRLGAFTVRILGGEAAVSGAVEAELVADGLEVVRTFGATRLETAAAIADLLDQPDAALLARAFASEGAADPSQAFADSLAAGGWAAAAGRPVLLTQTHQLSSATAAHLASGVFSSLSVLGGEAAVAPEVAGAAEAIVPSVERFSGATRFATATEIAAARGFTSTNPASIVIVVEGQAASAWGAGFSAANLAAVADAPILLANGDALPAESAAFLADSTVQDAVLVCAASEAACVAAEALLDRS